MSWIWMAVIVVVLAISFVGLTRATVHIDTSPQLRGHGRRSLVSTGWVLVALTFAVAALYVVWLIDTLTNRGLVTPRDGMLYVPLLVLGVVGIWSIWAGITYRRNRHTRRAARGLPWRRRK